MSPVPLVPGGFWFRVAFSCPLHRDIPLSGKKRLLDLPSPYTLPALARLEGHQAWAEARAAWNPRGLAVSISVNGRAGRQSVGTRSTVLEDRVELGIDTRDTRDIHRASRFCHWFTCQLNPGREGPVSVAVNQKPIARALADAPHARRDTIQTYGERSRTSWLVEVFFSSEALNGFDPETNRRLGLIVLVSDSERGEQSFGPGREFPVETDPSLWPVLQLEGAG